MSVGLPAFCCCLCHREVTDCGTPLSGIRPVSTTDVLEAAVACPRCLNQHTPALLTPPDPLPEPTPPPPKIDRWSRAYWDAHGWI